ncbi:VOC family protein [Pseudoxanthomonas suwonensis]|uniref:VOC family protein n=1 Tax=Pseudoxanthomonas suwonensis TaxID=314722 RepID=UPI00048DA106|nr:VOC family protein [Pseudoxanthomonas suwonensis]
MASQIFVNLPVKDLDRSVAFFTALGFSFNPQFTDENATCMLVGENIFVMLLVEPYFATFTGKPVSDATRQTEVLVALALESREAVDGMVAKVVAAGGTVTQPARDLGFMYQQSFADLDGHQWEPFHMNPDALPPQG